MDGAARQKMDDHSTQFSISLWDYALILYARPGVAAACLALQDDYGIDVCELLWLCWLNRLGLTTNTELTCVLAPIRAHQATLTRLLRERRRELKPHASSGSSLAEWREAIKSAELAAERGTLLQLQALTQRDQIVRPLRPDDVPLITSLAQHAGQHDQSVIDRLNMLAAQA